MPPHCHYAEQDQHKTHQCGIGPIKPEGRSRQNGHPESPLVHQPCQPFGTEGRRAADDLKQRQGFEILGRQTQQSCTEAEAQHRPHQPEDGHARRHSPDRRAHPPQHQHREGRRRGTEGDAERVPHAARKAPEEEHCAGWFLPAAFPFLLSIVIAFPPTPCALSTGQCSHHCRKRQLEAHVIDRVPVAQTHKDACRAQRGERIRRASHPDAEGADPDRHRRPEDRGRRAGDAHQQKGRSGPEQRPHPPVSPAALPLLVGQSIQQAAEDGDVEAAHHQHMGKPRAPVGAAESRSQMAPVAHHHRGQNAAGVFGHAFSQGAAQRRLEPSRPGAEAFALPKTKHPGQIFRAEDNAVGVVVQTLGGIRHIQRKAAPDAASGLTFGQTGALHPEVDSLPVHFFHHQHGTHPARRVSAACALHFGGEGRFFSGVGVLYLCKPRAGRFHDADAQHCAQKQADRIPSRGPASPPDQQAEDNKNCRRRQQKPHLRQK